jgi:hypothetical protein
MGLAQEKRLDGVNGLKGWSFRNRSGTAICSLYKYVSTISSMKADHLLKGGGGS